MKNDIQNKIPDSTILQIEQTCLFRVENENQITLLSLADRNAYRIKGLGAYLWLSIDGQRSVAEIVHSCQRDLAIEDSQFPHSAKSFLSDVLEKKLIKISNTSTQPTEKTASSSLAKLNLKVLSMDIAGLSLDCVTPRLFEAAGDDGGGY